MLMLGWGNYALFAIGLKGSMRQQPNSYDDVPAPGCSCRVSGLLRG